MKRPCVTPEILDIHLLLDDSEVFRLMQKVPVFQRSNDSVEGQVRRIIEMIIVDLYSQREAVAACLRELGDSDKLAWLRERGELIEIPMPDRSPVAYRFRSPQGIETGFVIRDGKMIFIGDHTTIGAVEID